MDILFRVGTKSASLHIVQSTTTATPFQRVCGNNKKQISLHIPSSGVKIWLYTEKRENQLFVKKKKI